MMINPGIFRIATQFSDKTICTDICVGPDCCRLKNWRCHAVSEQWVSSTFTTIFIGKLMIKTICLDLGLNVGTTTINNSPNHHELVVWTLWTISSHGWFMRLFCPHYSIFRAHAMDWTIPLRDEFLTKLDQRRLWVYLGVSENGLGPRVYP